MDIRVLPWKLRSLDHKDHEKASDSILKPFLFLGRLIHYVTGKLDFKKSLMSFYAPKNTEFQLVELPLLRYLAIDGIGAPESEEFSLAIQALYSTAYPLKFISQSATGKDYVVPPLEAL